MRRLNDNQSLIEEFYETLDSSCLDILPSYETILSMYEVVSSIRGIDPNVELGKIVSFFTNTVTVDEFDNTYKQMNSNDVLLAMDESGDVKNFVIYRSWLHESFPF